MSEIKTVMVVGAGFMGSGIAQVCAAAGFKVLLWDVKDEFIQNGLKKVSDGLITRVSRGKMTEEAKSELLDRIKPVIDLEAASDADLVIEAVVEDKKVKCDIFKKCDQICPQHTILASNTSAIPISTLAIATNRGDRFIGTHFFSPVPIMKLVEIVRGLKTSPETCEIVKAFILRIEKTGVIVKDGPGFLVNRVMHAFRNEVFNCLEEGVASLEDIDTAIKLGLGHPMGPFELNDFAGLDIGLATSETLWENYKEPKWRPYLTVRRLVEAGELGRKTGKGWYDYTSGEKKPRTDIHF